jgi:dTDP-L-rhamnose 4-epimerase
LPTAIAQSAADETSMRKQILITGGAGFIGSHLAERLLEAGHEVRALDSLVSHVHGKQKRRPAHLHRSVDLVVGDVRDPEAVARALDGIDIVYHLAAMVGIGQSMYRLSEYASVNGTGTAALLEALLKRKVERLIVASSMSIYGEGLCASSGTPNGASFAEIENRGQDQLRRGEWELSDRTGRRMSPVPTPETKTPSLDSVYALTKFDQERLSLMVGRAYDLPTIALRFFNVYGPRQTLSNPYTGILAVFASRLLNDHPPQVFEDGLQRRDFVSVHDAVEACVLALDREEAVGKAINVGSGQPRTMLEVARAMAKAMDRGNLEPEVPGRYRFGDVRHCFADIALARSALGYEPKVEFEKGLVELVAWLQSQMARDRRAEPRPPPDAPDVTP